MNIRQKSVLWGLLLALLMGLTGCQATGTPYILPVDGEQVKRSVLYRASGDQPWEKVELVGEEVSAAVEAVSGIRDWGDYGAQGVPAGGTSYILALWLSDETQWVCVYYDSGTQKFFSDGETKILVTDCGLAALWETVSSRAEQGEPGEELMDVPQL